MGDDALASFVRQHPRLFVLTGAGVSLASGIPAYRDADGRWTRALPVHLQDFLASEGTRRRYWMRSMAGYPLVARAQPNPAHRALVELERGGYLASLVTQNVDGLHQRAGSAQVVELHGSLATVTCRSCGAVRSRASVQAMLERDNAGLVVPPGAGAPDGDAEVDSDAANFRPPACPACDGVLKPDVVFFGEGVPAARVERARAALAAADAMLVVGSSLMVWSGYRFCEWAQAAAKPIAAINPGRTRADPLLTLKVAEPCAQSLGDLVSALCG
ncbi:MAG: NAD-dependent protein deacetylase [Proteobacteria bacterium]|jgi:NAD-dependent SIR2 family protein deacetylase|nr:NAD-dependent protein deacetylase [Pseudomonadota bacterium]